MKISIFCSFIFLCFIFSCAKPDPFQKLDRDADSFESYIDENEEYLQGRWKYFMDDLRGDFVIFYKDDKYYSRFVLDNNKFIKTESLRRHGDTLFVADPVGKYYVRTVKGNYNVFFKGNIVTALYRNPIKR